MLLFLLALNCEMAEFATHCLLTVWLNDRTCEPLHPFDILVLI